MSLLSESDKRKFEKSWTIGAWSTWLGIYLSKNCWKLEKFENLHSSPINLRFLENDKSSLSKAFIESKAKFHNSCDNRHSGLKLERAQKRLK